MNMQDVTNLAITEGDVRTIHDSSNNLLWGKLSYDTKYEGDTVQDGTPTPDAPVAVQTVTGEQTVTIGDGVNSESFTVDLGSIELCKIGTYQDYIYKSGDDWYVHKEIGKVVLDGSSDEEWVVTNSGQANFFYRYRFISYNTSSPLGVSNNFVYADIVNVTTNPGFMLVNNNQVRFRPNFAELSVADWRTWLSTHNTTVYYALATATDTQITDNTLIGQLEAVHEWLTRYGYNSTVSGTLPLIIEQTNLS